MNKTGRTWVIYALRCPDTNGVRYVGWTVNLVNRLAVHRYRAANKNENRTYCEKWVNSLLRKGKEPVVEILQRGIGPWEQSEKDWIAHFRKQGARLCNLTEGGEGCLGYVVTLKTRQAISIGNKGKIRSHSFRENIRQKMNGRVFTPEWKAKISAAKKRNNWMRGRHWDQAHKDNMRMKITGIKRSKESMVKHWETRRANQLLVQQN